MGQTTHVSEEMVLVRVRGRRGAVGDTELCVDVFDVARDGMRADRKHLGDLAVGAARDQVHQHFSFARGQHCAWFPLPALRQPERQRADMLHVGSSA